MRSAMLIGAAFFAGCGGSAPPSAHPTGGDGVPVAPPMTPAPTVATDGGRVVATGLPAIARASEIVVVAVPDGANLRIDVRDRDDKTLRTFAATPATVAAANKELATLHGVHDLRAMTALAVEAGHDHEDQHWATGDNLDVEWRDHRLSVFRHNANAALVERDGTGWLVPDRGACTNPAFLDAAYHGAHSLVIAIGYRNGNGNDVGGCGPPDDQLHVVTWYDR